MSEGRGEKEIKSLDPAESRRFNISVEHDGEKYQYSLRDRNQIWFQWALSVWSVFTIFLTFYILLTVWQKININFSDFELILFIIGLVIFVFSFGSSVFILVVIALIPILRTAPQLVITTESISDETEQIALKNTIKLEKTSVNGAFRYHLSDGEHSIAIFNHEHYSDKPCIILNQLKEKLQVNHNIDLIE